MARAVTAWACRCLSVLMRTNGFEFAQLGRQGFYAWLGVVVNAYPFEQQQIFLLIRGPAYGGLKRPIR